MRVYVVFHTPCFINDFTFINPIRNLVGLYRLAKVLDQSFLNGRPGTDLYCFYNLVDQLKKDYNIASALVGVEPIS